MVFLRGVWVGYVELKALAGWQFRSGARGQVDGGHLGRVDQGFRDVGEDISVDLV